MTDTDATDTADENGYSEVQEDDDTDPFADGFQDVAMDMSQVNPPDGEYLSTIDTVEYRRNVKEDKTTHGFQVTVRLVVDPQDEAAAPFNNSFQQKYIWLGNQMPGENLRPDPRGLKAWKSFIKAATGTDISGQVVKLSEYIPETAYNAQGKKIVRLTVFDGLPIAVDLFTEPDKQNPDIEYTRIRSWSSAEVYSKDFTTSSEEPF